LDHFLSPEGYSRIVKQLKEAGKTPPSRKLIRLAWEDVPDLDIEPIVLETPNIECEDLAF